MKEKTMSIDTSLNYFDKNVVRKKPLPNVLFFFFYFRKQGQNRRLDSYDFSFNKIFHQQKKSKQNMILQ